MNRAFAVLLAMLLGFSSPAMAMGAVIEQLRLQVPAVQRTLWLKAEARTWQACRGRGQPEAGRPPPVARGAPRRDTGRVTGLRLCVRGEARRAFA